MEKGEKENPNKNSVEWISSVLGKVDQFLHDYELKIRVADGLQFNEDEMGNVRVQLSIGKKWIKKEEG